MDNFGLSRATLRSRALDKLACFTAKASSPVAKEDYGNLSKSLGNAGTLFAKHSPKSNGTTHVAATNGDGQLYNIPIQTKELEVLLALASSAKHLSDRPQAEKLLEQLGLYLRDSYRQKFVPSALTRELQPSPWEVVTYNLTLAIIDIAKSFNELFDTAGAYLSSYVDGVERESSDIQAATPGNIELIFPLAFSLQGFLAAICLRSLYKESSELQYHLLSSANAIFSGQFLTCLAEAISLLRNSPDVSPTHRTWNLYRNKYRALGKPVGPASLQYYFIETARYISGVYVLPGLANYPGEIESFLDIIISSGQKAETTIDDIQRKSLELCRDVAICELESAEEGNDYISAIVSGKQRRLNFAIKASALEILCVASHFDLYDIGDLMQAIEDCLNTTDNEQKPLIDEGLLSRIFKIMAFLCVEESSIGASLTRIFPRLVVSQNLSEETIHTGTICVSFALKRLSEDAVISTLYTMSNILVSVPHETDLTRVVTTNDIAMRRRSGSLERVSSMGSRIFINAEDREEIDIIFENVLYALAKVVEQYNDNKITALTISVLMQKIGHVNAFTDRCLLLALSGLSLCGAERDFKTVLRLYSRLNTEALNNKDQDMIDTILDARLRIAKKLQRNDPFYSVYLMDLLDGIVSKGDVQELEHHRPHSEIDRTAKEISLLITTLATLLPSVDEPRYTTDDQAILTAFRNAWFNMVVHGYSRNSDWTKKPFRADLETVSWNSPTLIAESSSNQFESDMEINTVLRRGSSHRNLDEQRKQVLEAFDSTALEVRTIPYPKLIFLSSALLLESLRASAGDCSKVLLYFVDPSLKSGETAKFMKGVANEAMKIYLKKVQSKSDIAASGSISGQLRELLICCCHRINTVSAVAFKCAERLIEAIPSALCKRESLFTLLELLTLLWNSCLDEDVDQYSPRSVFVSSKANIRLELSDSYAHRKATLKFLHEKAVKWVQLAIDTIPLDMKGLLQSYLAEMDDFRAFGHVVLGRSFAVEMGGRIPYTDNKLISIDTQAGMPGTDTVSDFLAQFTWRQVYRRVDSGSTADSDEQLDDFKKIRNSLLDLRDKVHKRKYISIAELREGLLRAAAFCLGNEVLAPQLVHLLVRIPFSIFTKQSIKLGVSLWLWVLSEAPHLQSRVLSEIALGFEWSIRYHEGIYSKVHDLIPVLNGKMEYAPSSKEEIMHDARIAGNCFAPHLYIVDMLSSHFQSSKFGSRHIFEVFERSLRVALMNMENASSHPLVRENRFNIILFALRLLEGHNPLSSQRSTYFKSLTLTAALTWFSRPPIYPFSGNRLKLKSEFRLLIEVFQLVKRLTVQGLEKELFLDVKQELVLQFLENEIYGMSIWLEPLQFVPYRQLKTIIPKRSFEPTPQMVIVAWQVDPAMAVYYVKRFKLPELDMQLQQLIIADTSKIAHIPDAVQYLLDRRVLDTSAPQLKYLLFWAPVSPVEAINLFMPDFSNNSLILQYAMRSLESHNVDVAFFYVPQIVQMLRHEPLGYIEQYILETGKLDQLFAHQIIWNMRANAYKDEDMKVPDPLKPNLDRVMETLINSFDGEDRDFYNREFAFFKEVTSISGKLKPYIKKTKAEKKAKIDEEMRKIKVAHNVYLPSNPDGSVVGIDRKSGRPLQSHAKAPFMATFKIKKTVKTSSAVMVGGEDDSENPAVETIEKWLSAIFKVGDDCRQDMLALQLIALFRSIFNASGLDLFLFPNRVIATDPGCGIIEVLPNSISRDMLGREAVNGLYEYFISKHGSEDSIKFQQARNNFVQSMAAYSVISYLLQFKDRHNGNIMYDDQGHILHIDFGFCFDIVPGGVKFEAAPFKLTHEMVQVMGGSSDTQAYHWFEELCIKAFLACRPYAENIIQCVRPMLESGLPCFKGETTIRKLRDRFALDKSDKEAAVHMRGLIKKSAESIYTKGYDEFQRMTNGIPY
ncbi:hypothetical protein V1525DRAFT_401672 [Lipomyces kononenkoae]|uniref:Uncharacterized protein n=1 Tax=Lipomyces kononenkoae TaxID=34357 RepID=A0ACC3T319_LIPKO